MDAPKPLRHIRCVGRTKTENYRPINRKIDKKPLPGRNRGEHGKKLLEQLESTKAAIDAVLGDSTRAPSGFNLVIEGESSLEDELRRLDSERQGVELVNVRPVVGGIEATVYVQQGKLTFFTKRVEDYLSKDSPKGEPRNAPLITRINDIGLAALKHFWTDAGDLPALGQTGWWEVWVRSTGRAAGENLFRQEASSVGLSVSELVVRFPDRVVLLVFGQLERFQNAFLLLDVLAEIRKAKECPTAFRRLRATEQKEWADDLIARVQFQKNPLVSVCLLDTGLDHGHPLLSPFTSPSHVLTCFASNLPADHDGHGSEMGGLALYGDLAEALAGKDSIEIPYALESVKILPEVGKNHPDNYGAITEQAVYRIETAISRDRRAFCMAVAATDFRDRGQPSSWSATLDQLSFGEPETETKRLFLVCAGNTNPEFWHQYPESNRTDGIHDPGQSWNALTVGAYTDRVTIHDPDYADWRPLADAGCLGPSSTTATIWSPPWPNKPDFVLEGGNYALHPEGTHADSIDDLSILTTSRMAMTTLFSLTGETSSATALAARMAGSIFAAYPEYWPETVRALLVHSAEWTKGMLEQFPGDSKNAIKERLRCVGFGVPSLKRALWCATNELTLVTQEKIQPFDCQGQNATLRSINLHDLPWPTAELQSLGEAPVTMRVTLSYFIEPSPGRRGWKSRHRYASHGLRFEVKRPLEKPESFRARLNQIARDEEEEKYTESGEKQKWVIGSVQRSKGSLHSDWWTGTAAELAECNQIGIFPVAGWWKERTGFERWKQSVRYSLVVSIKTQAQTVDLYTPVETQISIPISV